MCIIFYYFALISIDWWMQSSPDFLNQIICQMSDFLLYWLIIKLMSFHEFFIGQKRKKKSFSLKRIEFLERNFLFPFSFLFGLDNTLIIYLVNFQLIIICNRLFKWLQFRPNNSLNPWGHGLSIQLINFHLKKEYWIVDYLDTVF